VRFVGDPSNISAALLDAQPRRRRPVCRQRHDGLDDHVTVRDVNGNPVAGQSVPSPRPAATTRWSSRRHGPSGVATGTIATTTAETKTITARSTRASQVVAHAAADGHVRRRPEQHQRLSDDGDRRAGDRRVADGLAISTITVTVRDANGNPVAGQTVQLCRRRQQQHARATGRHGSGGVATGTIAARPAETKTITAP
jgi:adhesin/invasin